MQIDQPVDSVADFSEPGQRVHVPQVYDHPFAETVEVLVREPTDEHVGSAITMIASTT